MPTRRRRRRRSRAVALLACLALVVTGGVLVLDRLGASAPPVVERCLAQHDGQTVALAPDQAEHAALIAAVAAERRLPARAVTIGLATAMQESRLRNIDYGDRDSLGLFQQRPSQGWGSPEQVTDPVYATNAFYDGLVGVDGYETLEITVAAQAVQRSGFPDAYAQHEQLARLFASALTGHSPAALTCRLREAPAADAPAAFSTRLARDLPSLRATDGGGSVLVDVTPLVPDGDATATTRLTWAVAQWAVATAHATGAMEVTAEGHTWRRTDGADATWVPVAAGSEPGAGTVRVR